MTSEANAEAIVDYDGVVKDLADLKVPTLADYWKDGRIIDPEFWTNAMKAACKKYRVRRLRSRKPTLVDGQEEFEVDEYIIDIGTCKMCNYMNEGVICTVCRYVPEA